MFNASIRGLGLLNYEDSVVSGERHFLKTFLSLRKNPIVLDVGANEGSYATSVLTVNRTARVFAFEPHPKTFERLARSLSKVKGITAINAACGSASGKLALYDYFESSGSQHASLRQGVIEQIHKRSSSHHLVDVIDLDTFAKEHNITSIDLLKIDTEGYEYEVLKGAAHLVQENRIGAIQFEFTQLNVVSRVFMRDFYEILPNYNFSRMLRNGLLPLGPYSPVGCELFAFQNIVALPNAIPFQHNI